MLKKLPSAFHCGQHFQVLLHSVTISSLKSLFSLVNIESITMGRNKKVPSMLRTNQIVGFFTMLSWKKNVRLLECNSYQASYEMKQSNCSITDQTRSDTYTDSSIMYITLKNILQLIKVLLLLKFKKQLPKFPLTCFKLQLANTAFDDIKCEILNVSYIQYSSKSGQQLKHEQ